jgi:hypothetical protein
MVTCAPALIVNLFVFQMPEMLACLLANLPAGSAI